MKKVIGAAIVLALTGGVAYAVIHNHERSACMKVADLCGVKNGTKADLDQCVEEIEQFRKVGGDEATEKGLRCVEEAKTCGEATGCIAGAGVKGMQGAINEFLKGFGKAAQ
jgi:hypothetical protein